MRFLFAPKILIYRQFLREKDFLSCSIFELTGTLIFWSGYPVEIYWCLNEVGKRGWKFKLKMGIVGKLNVKKLWKVFSKLKCCTEFMWFYAKNSNFK